MPITYVDTLEDVRLDAYARLTEVQLRSIMEPSQGIFIAESRKVIERALDSGHQPISLLTEEKWLTALTPIIERLDQDYPETPILVAPHAELEKITGFELTRGALGAFCRPKLRSVTDVIKEAHRVAVLEDITNHTNVGAIFRCAAALNIDAILVSPKCYDPYYRRAVRVSMGGVFQVPWTRIGNSVHNWAEAGLPLLNELGFKTVAMALTPEAISLDNPQLATEERLAIILGTEGEGLLPATIKQCDYVVHIPMAEGVDSLNVAAASAVAFWELRKK